MRPADGLNSAAAVFADLVDRLPADGWDRAGLGEWDLRSLVGHASRSLITVDTYLDRVVDVEVLPTAQAYLAAGARAVAADAAAVAERGRQAGLALGDRPAATVRSLVERVVPRVTTAGDPLVHTIAGGMRLSSYLPTRTLELVVHSFDIAAAAGLAAPEVPEDVMTDVVTLAASAAVLQGRGPELLMALTGRRRLRADFCVV